MKIRNCCIVALSIPTAILYAAPSYAVTPREMLTQAAFQVADKDRALAEVRQAIAMAEAQLATDPGNYEAQMQRAAGLGYRAKLTRNAGDAKTSRRLFEALASTNPRDPEAQMLIAGWHLDAISDLGGMLAGAVLGAKRAAGTAALDRAVARLLSGDRRADAHPARSERRRRGAFARRERRIVAGAVTARSRRQAQRRGAPGPAARGRWQSGGGFGEEIAAVRTARLGGSTAGGIAGAHVGAAPARAQKKEPSGFPPGPFLRDATHTR